ncbi:MAG: energy transducer TonB [Thermodesulfobacteriota bacterium]
MSLPKSSISGRISWFWGIVLSIALHGFIFLLVLYWGFGKSHYSAQPDFIEGRLISLSDLSRVGEVKPPPQTEKEIQEAHQKKQEAKQVEEKKEKPQELEKKKKTAPVPEIKEAKKEEPKEEIEEKMEEIKRKDSVALETEKNEKMVEKKPKPTKKPEPKKVKKKKKKDKPDFEKVKSSVLADLQKSVKEDKRRNVIEELKQNQNPIEEKVVAKSDTSQINNTNVSELRTGQSGRGGTRGVVTSLFLERIRNEIRRNYRIPPNIPTDGKLEAFIFFKMNEGGKVYDVRVDESSGNPAFDDFCVKAIHKSAPLTPPPPELIEQAKTVGFLIPFTNDPS